MYFERQRTRMRPRRPARVSKVRGWNVCRPRDNSAEDACVLSAGGSMWSVCVSEVIFSRTFKIRDVGPGESEWEKDALWNGNRLSALIHWLSEHNSRQSGPNVHPAAPLCLLSQQVIVCQRRARRRWKCRNSCRRTVGSVFGSGILFPNSLGLVLHPPLAPSLPACLQQPGCFAALRLSTLA